MWVTHINVLWAREYALRDTNFNFRLSLIYASRVHYDWQLLSPSSVPGLNFFFNFPCCRTHLRECGLWPANTASPFAIFWHPTFGSFANVANVEMAAMMTQLRNHIMSFFKAGGGGGTHWQMRAKLAFPDIFEGQATNRIVLTDVTITQYYSAVSGRER